MDHSRRRSVTRWVWTLVLGLFLGGLLTKLFQVFLPAGVTVDFFTTSVQASLGPLSVDFVSLAFVLGPLTVTLNVLTLVGIGIVAFFIRSWM
ncbi:MAG: hypothetical protein OEO23_11960 [Gemmatimonadota bacterium]|nr:hypothetical protein [Gemmatimonadota bacterium]